MHVGVALGRVAARSEEKELKSYAALQALEKTSNVGVSKTGTIEECKEIEEDFM